MKHLVKKHLSYLETSYNRHAYGGKMAQSNGKMFESYLDCSCKRYQDLGIATIEKTPEPFRILKRLDKGLVSGFYEKQAQVDYRGTLNGGRSILFEAKHTEEKRLPFSRVQEHQFKQLERESKLGAKCYILISYKLTDFYRVPFAVWKKHVQFSSKKSMSLKDLEAYRIDNNGMFIEFLKGVEADDE